MFPAWPSSDGQMSCDLKKASVPLSLSKLTSLLLDFFVLLEEELTKSPSFDRWISCLHRYVPHCNNNKRTANLIKHSWVRGIRKEREVDFCMRQWSWIDHVHHAAGESLTYTVLYAAFTCLIKGVCPTRATAGCDTHTHAHTFVAFMAHKTNRLLTCSWQWHEHYSTYMY